MLVDKVNTWLFYTFTRHVGAQNQCFMSANRNGSREAGDGQAARSVLGDGKGGLW
jgi:hypothetical protein